MIDNETKERIKPHLREHFPDDDDKVESDMEYMFTECYSTVEEGHNAVALKPLMNHICLVFDIDDGENLGIQNWDYVKENWRLL